MSNGGDCRTAPATPGLFQLFSQHPMHEQGSPCCNNFLYVTQNYHSNVTPIGAMHAKNITEIILLNVFRIAFPASLFMIIDKFYIKHGNFCVYVCV